MSQLEPDVSDELIDHALALDFDTLPTRTVANVRRQVLDTLGACIAGLDAPGCREVHDMVAAWGGAPNAGLIGYGGAAPAPMAALVNGTTGRAMEIDDVHEQALTHSTVTMVPVALAVAASTGNVHGRDLICAVALGNDLAVRLALAARQRFEDGGAPRRMSLTYQTAALAGAVVAAKVADSPKHVMADAFGNAYSQLAGNLQGLKEGSLTVRAQQGVASMSAVLAWEMAERGITGGRRPLQGVAGWFDTFHDGRFDRDALTGGLGRVFRGDEISTKPYPCCKYGHNAISAALAAVDGAALDPRAIERIVITISTQDMWDILCEPLSLKARLANFDGPDGVALAQFSLPYQVASAIARGRFGIAELGEGARRDEVVGTLMSKVEVVNLNRSLGPEDLPEPATVRIHLADGTELSAESSRPLGHPDNPMSDAQVAEKFDWAAGGLTVEQRGLIVDTVMSLESCGDVRELVEATAV